MEKRLSGWKRELWRAHGLIAGLFARSEICARSLSYLQGLLSNCERKNGWQLAEWMGEGFPYAVQHLLNRARWDADQVRDRIRSYALEELSSAEAVLIVDETGFLKKGSHSAGVKRQYSGTAGRIENSQVGVFLCYGSDKGATLVDHELHIPQEWIAGRWSFKRDLLQMTHGNHKSVQVACSLKHLVMIGKVVVLVQQQLVR